MLRLGHDIKSNSHVLLSISIGHPKQTQTGFCEIVDAVVNCSKISKLTLLKADTLQRYTLALNERLSESDAYERALILSDQWDKDNQPHLDRLSRHDFSIRTWDDYRLASAFKEYFAKVITFYKNNAAFRHDVNNLARNYLKKLLNDNANLDHEMAFEVLKAYLIEECAVLMQLGHDTLSFDYELYRGKRNLPMKAVYKKFMSPCRMIAIPLLDMKMDQHQRVSLEYSFKKTGGLRTFKLNYGGESIINTRIPHARNTEEYVLIKHIITLVSRLAKLNGENEQQDEHPMYSNEPEPL